MILAATGTATSITATCTAATATLYVFSAQATRGNGEAYSMCIQDMCFQLRKL